jgi:MvaI/BcnI restriction endonuclease family
VSFDHTRVAEHHRHWLSSVQTRAGLGELDPRPYWGFDDLEHIVGTKLLNCFYVQAEVKKKNERELYRYSKVMMLQRFRFDKFWQRSSKGSCWSISMRGREKITAPNFGCEKICCLPYMKK